MEKIDYVLDFCVHTGMEMLECGANLERVKLSIQKICKKYNLHEVSIFVLNNHLSVGAREADGAAATRQISVPYNEIHLEKLRRLNNLVEDVCTSETEPEALEDKLYEAIMVRRYSNAVNLIGYCLAMSCLCRIFGGHWQDILITDAITVLLYFISNIFAREKMNRIISNVICMFLSGVIAGGFTYIGFATDIFAIIITNAFFLIPGIPLVNSVRNILCGHEMNGILELLKVILEVLTIVAGLYIAYFLFGKNFINL